MVTFQNIYADIHVHPTLKPFLAKNINDPWKDYAIVDESKQIYRTTQFTRANFNALFESNTRLICHYLTVLERYLMSKTFTQPAIMARILSIDFKKLKEIYALKPFSVLLEELNYLKSYLVSEDKKHEVVIIKNYQDLETTLKDPNKLAILLGVEGAHCLGFEYLDYDFNKVEPPDVPTIDLVNQRIEFMKNEHFKFLTINHFIYNHLGTMPKVVELNGIKKVISNPINTLKSIGSFRGLTFLGQYLVKKCLENKIFLDIKHCDALTRHQIYQLAKEYGFPVVASHAAVSGRPTNIKNAHEMIILEDKGIMRTQSDLFNPWDINFHDDDILAIHQLNGVIGIIMDRRVLTSEKILNKFIKEKRNHSLFIFYQIEHIYDVLTKHGVEPEKAFDSIAIGSDFDGLIEPIYSCTSVRDYPKLEMDLITFVEMNYEKFRPSGLTPHKIVSKVMRENVLNMLKKYL